MDDKAIKDRSQRILNQLKTKYPNAKSYDLDGRGMHFVCEVEPVEEHPEYDRAVEVMILTRPHKHFKMTQYYTVISGTLELHIGKETVVLNEGDKYTVTPENSHWAKSVGEKEAWVELYSTPGWTKEDHILVEEKN